MKIKTSELTDAALDWAVAKAEGFNAEALVELAKRVPGKNYGCFLTKYSTDPAQAYLISEREGIAVMPCPRGWAARIGFGGQYVEGPTRLVAEMRCYVASKLGDEVEIPEELS